MKQRITSEDNELIGFTINVHRETTTMRALPD